MIDVKRYDLPSTHTSMVSHVVASQQQAGSSVPNREFVGGGGGGGGGGLRLAFMTAVNLPKAIIP